MAGPAATTEPAKPCWASHSLHRKVGLSRFAAGVALTRGAAVSATESALDWPADLAHTWLGSWMWLKGHFR